MKFLHIDTLLFVTLLSVVSPLQGAERTTFTIFGAPSCSEWQKNRNEEKRVPDSSIRMGAAFNRTWLMGFVSGLNAAISTNKDMLGAVDADTIVTWMDRYCNNNSKSDLSTGSIELFIELSKITR